MHAHAARAVQAAAISSAQLCAWTSDSWTSKKATRDPTPPPTRSRDVFCSNFVGATTSPCAHSQRRFHARPARNRTASPRVRQTDIALAAAKTLNRRLTQCGLIARRRSLVAYLGFERDSDVMARKRDSARGGVVARGRRIDVRLCREALPERAPASGLRAVVHAQVQRRSRSPSAERRARAHRGRQRRRRRFARGASRLRRSPACARVDRLRAPRTRARPRSCRRARERCSAHARFPRRPRGANRHPRPGRRRFRGARGRSASALHPPPAAAMRASSSANATSSSAVMRRSSANQIAGHS